MHVVREYMGWGISAGLIPLPLFDVAAIVIVGFRHGAPLADSMASCSSRSAAKSVIGALVGGGGTYILATPIASLVKAIPVVGTLAGVLTEPALAAAATYALGKVFIQHFESGGTLLDFNLRNARHQYEQHFAAAREKGAANSNFSHPSVRVARGPAVLCKRPE